MSAFETCSIVTSASALVLTAIFATIGWRHQRLSARPHCHFVSTSSRTDNHKLGIYLRNNGPGVAIVAKWEFFYAGNAVGKNLDGLKEIRRKIGEADTGRYWIEVEDSLQANSVEKILWLEKDLEKSPFGKALLAEDNLFLAKIDQIGIKLTIKSIYNEMKVVPYDPKNQLDIHPQLLKFQKNYSFRFWSWLLLNRSSKNKVV